MPRAKHTALTITKRRQQLTRQLVMQMMDVKVRGGDDTPGLLTKLMKKLDTDLESTDEELRHKAMDKIIKLLPFVIAKEKAPQIQLNVQNNTMGNPQITTGKSTLLAVGTIQDYLKNREKQMVKNALPRIEKITEAEVIEIETEGDDGNEEEEK